MNWDQIAGQWKQFKGKAKEKWGKLTDDEIDVIEGKRDQLVGKIQQRYGIAKDQAEKEVDQWAKGFYPPPTTPGTPPQCAPESRFAGRPACLIKAAEK